MGQELRDVTIGSKSNSSGEQPRTVTKQAMLSYTKKGQKENVIYV